MTLRQVSAVSGAAQRWPVWRPRLRGLIALAGLTLAVALTRPSVGWVGAACLVAVAVGWLAWMVLPRDRIRASFAAAVLVGAGGVVLSVLQTGGPAVVFPALACLNAGARTPPRWSVPFALVLGGALAASHAIAGHGGVLILVGPAVCLVGLMFGLIRRQNDELAEETRLVRAGQARSAALDERARIAREIHDVLAHSLAALTVQLETADALLETGRAEQARQSVMRAGQLAREGLAETRRAIGALRGETLPLPELLTGLAARYQADFAASAPVRVDGVPREVNPDIALALYRTAQESVTNVRKHAPGADVELALRYEPAAVALAVTNGGTPEGTDRPLAGSGGGYGLIGLRERAELAGGTFSAGPDAAGWRVDVRIPG